MSEHNDVLREVAATLHKIATAMDIRGMRTEHLSTPLYESMMKKKMTDEQISDEAIEGFEKIVMLLKELGETDITIFNCKPGDITP